jgi:hypothetical protein
VGIFRDYPLKTRTSKQHIGEILGYEIIPSHPLKYPRSKQGLMQIERKISVESIFMIFGLAAGVVGVLALTADLTRAQHSNELDGRDGGTWR